MYKVHRLCDVFRCSRKYWLMISKLEDFMKEYSLKMNKCETEIMRREEYKAMNVYPKEDNIIHIQIFFIYVY